MSTYSVAATVIKTLFSWAEPPYSRRNDTAFFKRVPFDIAQATPMGTEAVPQFLAWYRLPCAIVTLICDHFETNDITDLCAYLTAWGEVYAMFLKKKLKVKSERSLVSDHLKSNSPPARCSLHSCSANRFDQCSTPFC